MSIDRRVGALPKWRALALAAGLGAMAALAMPPVHAVPLLLLAFPPLVWLIENASLRRAAMLGLAFGIGHFTIGLYWVAFAFLVDPLRHGPLIPFIVGGLAALLALFIAAATLVARLIAGRDRRLALVLVLPATWTVGEWLRGWVLTGFPWNLAGMVWAGSDPMMQSAALWGVWGLSLATVYAAVAPALLVGGGRFRLSRFAPAWIAAILLGLLWAWGLARLGAAGDDTVAGIRLRLVQPDIPQTLKWRPGLGEQHIAKAVGLSLAPGFERLTAVIWPETTVPFALDRNPALGSVLAQAVPEGGLLLTGIPRTTPPGIAPVEFWNSMVALDRSGMVRGTYDKFHLVPLGEYVPVRGIPGVSRLAPSESDFSAGPGPRTLDLPGLPPVSPLICYEVIFPGEVVDEAQRPAWLLNLTNDAWFGLSAGPYQHFASARMRAVEEGLPLVRAANNGISGVVDGYGRVTASLGLGEEGILDVSLPAALPTTTYARFGDAIALGLALVLTLAGVIARRVR